MGTHGCPGSSGGTAHTTDARQVARNMINTATASSCPSRRPEVQLHLAEAVENHDMASLRHYIPLAISSHIPPRELESAWRTFDFEIGRICESESQLQKENKSLRHELDRLKDMEDVSNYSTAATSSDACLEARLWQDLQEAQLHAAHVECMLKGERERATTTHKEVLAELCTEMAVASKLLTELSAVRQQPLNSAPQEAWLDAITRAVRDATMPLMDHIENKTTEVTHSFPRRQSPLGDVDWKSEVGVPEPYLRGKVEASAKAKRYAPKDSSQAEESGPPITASGMDDPAADLTQCSVCMDRSPEVVMVPCGHIYACEACGKQLQECALCRQPVTQVLRVYYSSS